MGAAEGRAISLDLGAHSSDVDATDGRPGSDLVDQRGGKGADAGSGQCVVAQSIGQGREDVACDVVALRVACAGTRLNPGDQIGHHVRNQDRTLLQVEARAATGCIGRLRGEDRVEGQQVDAGVQCTQAERLEHCGFGVGHRACPRRHVGHQRGERRHDSCARRGFQDALEFQSGRNVGTAEGDQWAARAARQGEVALGVGGGAGFTGVELSIAIDVDEDGRPAQIAIDGRSGHRRRCRRCSRAAAGIAARRDRCHADGTKRDQPASGSDHTAGHRSGGSSAACSGSRPGTATGSTGRGSGRSLGLRQQDGRGARGGRCGRDHSVHSHRLFRYAFGDLRLFHEQVPASGRSCRYRRGCNLAAHRQPVGYTRSGNRRPDARRGFTGARRSSCSGRGGGAGRSYGRGHQVTSGKLPETETRGLGGEPYEGRVSGP